ncbi:MAG: TRAP transporter small permease [Thalassospira sp.]|uniref:TRAP transporter small permease protein n=1 Tax=Thalassospira povalilytica TaxID=732237 RepID=A0ABX4RD71_9PROT|nr:C4-dicarboxylate ABC transporter permease [Thalassospira sp. MCCC 1A02491]MAL39731.1 TRAP transporter small permease [Thalassospira sp.]PKR52553.1 TRAP transporter small permease [Thalassospira povalilytica]
MDSIGKILQRLEDTLHWGGCLALVIVAVLINADIVMRLVAGIPVQIQFEMTELYLMPALATLSLSRVYRDGGHLALDFMTKDLSGLFGKIVSRGRTLLAGVFFCAVTYMSGSFALKAFLRGEIEYGVIDWPLGWAYAAIPLGCGVISLRLLYDTLQKPAA